LVFSTARILFRDYAFYDAPKYFCFFGQLAVDSTAIVPKGFIFLCRIACDTIVSYFPVENIGLSYDLARHMTSGGETDVAESLFDSFVRETSDEKLAEAAKNFKQRLNSAIARYPHGVS
jgi:hypothetical protein